MKRARALIRVLSYLVPRRRRHEWRDEWEGELWALQHRSTERRTELQTGWFVAGALPHALAEFASGWSAELLYRDLRYAVRSLLKARGFTLTAVLLLALGVTATTTVYTITNAVLFRAPRAVGDAAALIQIGRATETHAFDNWSQPLYDAFRSRSRTLEDVAAYATRGMVIGVGTETESVTAQVVSPNYFDVLQVELPRGAGLRAQAGTPIVVISDALWRRRFGSLTDVLGRPLHIAGQPFEIVGVAPPGFFGADIGAPAPDVWIPLGQQSVLGGYERLNSRMVSWLWLVGRRRDGVAAAAVQRELSGILAAEEVDLAPERRSRIALDEGLRIRPEDRVLANRISQLLMGSVFLVLLIACSNLSALLLARGAARRGELGVRLAIGASRGRIVRQLLVESATIAVLGSGLAFALTFWTARWVTYVFPYDVAPSFTPDLRVLAFALALGVTTTLVFSLVPALLAVRVDVSTVLQAAGARASWRQAPLRVTLVVTQIALSFTLLVGTTLLLRTLQHAAGADPGYRTEGLFVADLRFTALQDSSQERARLQLAGIATALSDVARIRRVSYATAVPGTGELANRSVWRTDSPPVDLPPIAYHIAVDTGYFNTAGVLLEQGRPFAASDAAAAPAVVIVNRTLARRLWGDAEPVGQYLSFGTMDGERSAQVVGVAADTRNRSLRQPAAPQLYLPYQQTRFDTPVLYLDAPQWDVVLQHDVAAVIRRYAPDLPPVRFEPIAQRLGRSLADVRLVAIMGSIFGGLALLLALCGLYGVIAYAATQRRREFAVRLAFGAAPLQIAALVLRQGLLLVAAGLLLGCAAAALTMGALRSMLYGVSPLDVSVFSSVAALLAFAAACANLLPAWRSAHGDPNANLRPE